MKAEVLNEWVTLYEGDCRDVIPSLDGIDAVVTDPPYGISYATNFTVGGVGASWRGRKIACDDTLEAREWVLAWARERNLPWAVFGSWKMPKPDGVRGVLVWDKGPAFGMGDLSFPWKNSWEEIYIGGPGWSGNRDEGVLKGHAVVSWESMGRSHPTEKPISLLRAIVSKSPGERVLDPFAGSGSTALACMAEGRKCVLVECDAGYCELIRRRVREADGTGPGQLFRQLELC